MELSNKQKIGTHFKKENIFLATVSASKADTKETLTSKLEGIISLEQFDVFYKDDTGYTRFLEEGPETFAGDNSDGKGTIRNVVSVWEYYSEEQIFECVLDNKFMAICVLDMNPLYKYNEDYNKA